MRLTVIRHEMMVGWFVVGAMLLGATGAVVNTRSKGLINRSEFSFVVDHGRGLKVGAPVEMQGIEVGNVSTMQMISHHEVQIGLLINRVYVDHIRRDASAAVIQPPLIGATRVEIEPGREEARATPGQVLTARDEVALMDRVGQLDQKVDDVISRVDTFVGAAVGTLDEFRKMVDRIDKSDGLAGQVIHDPGLAADVRGTVASLKQAGEEANTLLRQLTDEEGEFRRLLRDVDGTVVDVRETLEQADVIKTAESLRATSDALTRTAARMDVSEETRETLAAMKRASAAFRDLARELERQPDSVIFGRSPSSSSGLRRK